MAKLKNPLASLAASGSLAKALTFLKRRGQDIVEAKPLPDDPRTLAQLSWRHMYTKAVALWNALSPAEKQEWESLARGRYMTGFAWFISQALKPNPGLYLPLQGGTMQGDIDMATHRILDLIDPTLNQEPVTLKYFNDNLPVGGYTEGARAYHNANQSVPNATIYTLAFNSERWDTDNIHDNITFNSRLTAKTAGKYLIICHFRFPANATGARYLWLKVNATTEIAYTAGIVSALSHAMMLVSTIYNLAVNDFVEALTEQTSGDAMIIGPYAEWTPEFMMQRIG